MKFEYFVRIGVYCSDMRSPMAHLGGQGKGITVHFVDEYGN